MSRVSTAELHGRLVLKRESECVVVSETEYARGTRLSRHRHACAAVVMALDGRFEERRADATLDVDRGAALFRAAGAEHENHFGAEGARCLTIELHAVGSIAESVPSSSTPLRDPSTLHMLRRVRAECRSFDRYSRTAIDGIVLELMAGIGRSADRILPRAHEPAWVNLVKDHVQRHYCEPISLRFLAKIAGVHVTNLARTFRAHAGCTMGDYVRQQRLEAACARLASTDEPIAVVAAACGFYDQSHLSRAFQRCFGTTPARYRRESRSR